MCTHLEGVSEGIARRRLEGFEELYKVAAVVSIQ